MAYWDNPYFQLENPFAPPEEDSAPYGGFNMRNIKRLTPSFGDDVDFHDSSNFINIGNRNPSYVDYTPSTMLRKYLDLAEHEPTREDYQPTKWGGALATLSGIFEGMKGGPTRGMQAALSVRDMPYERAYGDYQNKLKGLREALASEQKEQDIRNMAAWRTGQLYDKGVGRDIQREEGVRKRNKDINQNQNTLARIKLGIDALNEKKSEFQTTSSETGRHNKAMEGIGQTNAAANTTRAAAASTNAETNKNKPVKKPKSQQSYSTPEDEITARKWATEKFFRENDPWWSSTFKDKKGHLIDKSKFDSLRIPRDKYQYMLNKIDAEAKNFLKQHPRYRMVEDDEEPPPSSLSQTRTIDY